MATFNKITRNLTYLTRFVTSPIVAIVLIIGLIQIIGGYLAWHFEHLENPVEFDSLINSIWWAIVTMTTVGYGSQEPITLGGRFVGGFVIFSGIIMVAILTGLVSSLYVTRKLREGKGLEKQNMENHIILCGWNSNAESVLNSILELSQEPLGVILVNELSQDQIETILPKYEEHNVRFVRGDFTRESVLNRASVENARAVILIPNFDLVTATRSRSETDEKTILATLTIKGIDSSIKVVAMLLDRKNRLHLKRAKADEIIISDEFSGFMLASHVLETGVSQAVKDLLDVQTKNRIRQVAIPNQYLGKPYRQLFDYFKGAGKVLIGVFSKDIHGDALKLSDFLSSDTSQIDHFIARKLEATGHSLIDDNRIYLNINPASDYEIQKGEVAIVIE